MKIVTGYKGTPHITSNDQQGFNQGVFGSGNVVLNVGNRLNATYVNETVTIADGEGVMQGVHFRIPSGETDDVTFVNTAAGYTRIDLLCARYTKAIGTGVESVEWHVIEGTPSTSTPSVPTAVSGDILGGATLADYPMWQVTVGSSGVTNVKRIADCQPGTMYLGSTRGTDMEHPQVWHTTPNTHAILYCIQENNASYSVQYAVSSDANNNTTVSRMCYGTGYDLSEFTFEAFAGYPDAVCVFNTLNTYYVHVYCLIFDGGIY